MAAYTAGKSTQVELAAVFGVGGVEKLFRQQRQNEQVERIEQRHGPVSRVDAAGKACLATSKSVPI